MLGNFIKMEKKISKLFILNILISITENLVVIPFKTLHNEEPPKFSSPLDIKTYWENNIIYSNTFIGTPQQNIAIFFHSQNFSSNLYYHMCDLAQSSFERKNSKTFSFKENLNRIYPMEKAFLVQDKFYFYKDLNTKQTKEYNLPFIYSDNEKEIQGDHFEEHDYTCMSIGLKMHNLVNYEPDSNFITQLKKNGIETYDFTLEYLNSEEGRIIIGEEPFIYDNTKTRKKYRTVGAMHGKDTNNFFLNFDNIYIMNNGKKEEIQSLSFKIIIDMGLIFGPDDYRQKIKSIFFDEMEKQGKCHEHYNNSQYFYWCEKNAENDIRNNFPTLYFDMKQFVKVFELTYKDLFKEKNDKLYFLMYFKNMNYNPYFEIGSIFLKKYSFTFNQYGNHIGYYNEDIKIEGEEEEPKSFWENKYLWIIISILIIVFAILGYIIGKKVKDNERKKRINEVDDDNYDYNEPENDDKRLFKSDTNNDNE